MKCIVNRIESELSGTGYDVVVTGEYVQGTYEVIANPQYNKEVGGHYSTAENRVALKSYNLPVGATLSIECADGYLANAYEWDGVSQPTDVTIPVLFPWSSDGSATLSKPIIIVVFKKSNDTALTPNDVRNNIVVKVTY